jgi:hypothetical protein
MSVKGGRRKEELFRMYEPAGETKMKVGCVCVNMIEVHYTRVGK